VFLTFLACPCVRCFAAQGYSLEVSPTLLETIIAEGYSDEYGVRPLRQTIIR
jgi:ATP-dependent Clp protease ATP-binding subunit ClpA